MANTLLTSSVVARAALAHLYENTIMLPLTHRDYENEFQPGRGATVTVKAPGTFEAIEYDGSTVTVQNMTETGIPVVLDKHYDVTFRVTSKERTLNVTDFSAQFLVPAMKALIQQVDRDILASLRAAGPAVLGDGVTSEIWSDPRVLIDAGEVLDTNNVPSDERYAVVGPTMKAEWLKDPLFNRVDQSGSTMGLTKASMGSEKFGFAPYMSQNVKDNVGVGFHKTALAFVTRPLEIPRGAADASVVEYEGLGLRVVFDYDMQLKADLCSIDVLYGTKVLDTDRIVIIDGSGSGS
jgi:hypothetical protein